MTSQLFTPIKLRGLTLENRIVVSPMCQYSADDGSATDWHMQHLGLLSHVGAALVVIEATGVEREGRITLGCLGLLFRCQRAGAGPRHRVLSPLYHDPHRHPAGPGRPHGLGRAAVGGRAIAQA